MCVSKPAWLYKSLPRNTSQSQRRIEVRIPGPGIIIVLVTPGPAQDCRYDCVTRTANGIPRFPSLSTTLPRRISTMPPARAHILPVIVWFAPVLHTRCMQPDTQRWCAYTRYTSAGCIWGTAVLQFSHCRSTAAVAGCRLPPNPPPPSLEGWPR
jgi:hypothetical protein